MWSRADWLVPHLNGVPYSEKPPLLFWLMHAGWSVLGVNDWWPRLLPGLLALCAVALTRALCKTLWPAEVAARALVPWLVLGSFGVVFYTQVVMFDLLLANCTLLALLGFARAAHARRGGWLLICLATALGLLSKGPVMLIHVGAPWLFGPWWTGGGRHGAWYLRGSAAVLGGGLLALGWALPAATVGGAAYGNEILFRQTAGRMVDSFAHAQPFWFYLAVFPVLLLPWSAWPSAWRALREGGERSSRDPGWRLLMLAVVAPFVALSAVSGKQPHYLLPFIAPMAALLAVPLARRCETEAASAIVPIVLLASLSAGIALAPRLQGGAALTVAPWSPVWGIAAAGTLLLLAGRASPRAAARRLALAAPLVMLAFEAAFFRANGQAFDLTPAASVIRDLQDRQAPVAHAGRYEGEYHFLGRLREPLEIIGKDDASIDVWRRTHLDGYVIRAVVAPPEGAVFQQRLRGGWLSIEGPSTGSAGNH
jgi:4-amino-4-deoxy-L-arabinose transferase-like glycosyltransferase